MPALPAADKVIKSAMKHVFGDSYLVNILYWLYTGTGPTEAELVTWATTLGTAWASQVMNLMSNAVTLESVTATDLSSDTSPEVIVPFSLAGASSQTPLPPNCAMVIKHSIARRYRGGHPRTYIGGLTENLVTGNRQWTSSTLSSMLADYESFVSDVEAAVWSGGGAIEQVNVSYVTGGARRTTPVVDPVQASSIQDRICSQRRRLGPLL